MISIYRRIILLQVKQHPSLHHHAQGSLLIKYFESNLFDFADITSQAITGITATQNFLHLPLIVKLFLILSYHNVRKKLKNHFAFQENIHYDTNY